MTRRDVPRNVHSIDMARPRFPSRAADVPRPSEDRPLGRGNWLGIDIGSRRSKLATLCRIASDGRGRITVELEIGRGREPYPAINTKATLVDPLRPPTYLRPSIEAEVARVVRESTTLGAWLADDAPSSGAAIDAPVAFAVEGRQRCTEARPDARTAQTFATPTREAFVRDLQTREDPYLRVNAFWKCVGLAVYRTLGCAVSGSEVTALDDIAGGTADAIPGPPRRLRETFPSDVYARANGRGGVLSAPARWILQRLVAPRTTWVGVERHGPSPGALRSLCEIRSSIHLDLAAGRPHASEMRKRSGTVGDLFDAFTCAFVASCEDHDAAVLRGADTARRSRLHEEGAILTVTTR